MADSMGGTVGRGKVENPLTGFYCTDGPRWRHGRATSKLTDWTPPPLPPLATTVTSASPPSPLNVAGAPTSQSLLVPIPSWPDDVSDLRHWTLLIRDLSEGGDVDKALALLPRMRANDLRPTSVTYAAAMTACHRAGRWQQALELLADMRKHGVGPNAAAYATAASSCAQSSAWEGALRLLGDLPPRAVVTHSAAYGAVLAACDGAGRWQEAVAILAEMRAGDVREDDSDQEGPSIVSGEAHGAVIRCCAKAGEWQRAIDLLNGMESEGHLPSVSVRLAAYRAGVEACEDAGEWMQALRLLEELPREDCPVDLLVRGRRSKGNSEATAETLAA
eukprot:TRINITY_DN49991_c0_g1_i1.p1 TRINITY_DN49991_c0_g1~~TRINITY_DN49991_c0_g1_i1.p1  ORF type:complete len:372 (-),score=47.70 TRINITY_DN49991_c0_g1_i1:102-1100(-)